jgi:hypothetical protein
VFSTTVSYSEILGFIFQERNPSLGYWLRVFCVFFYSRQIPKYYYQVRKILFSSDRVPTSIIHRRISEEIKSPLSKHQSNSMEQRPSWELTVSQLVKKFPTFYGIRRLITAFTRARHLSLSWASSIQSMPPHTTPWRSILILSSHLRLGLQRGRLPSGILTKILYAPLFPHTCHMPLPSHSSRFDYPNNIWRWVQDVIKPYCKKTSVRHRRR